MKAFYTAQETQTLIDNAILETCRDALFSDGTPIEEFIYNKLNEFNILKPNKPILVFKAIKNITGYTKEQIISYNKSGEISMVRQIGMLIVFFFENKNLDKTGEVFKRHHTTIINAKRNMEFYVKEYEENESNKSFFLLYTKIYNEYNRLKNQQ